MGGTSRGLLVTGLGIALAAALFAAARWRQTRTVAGTSTAGAHWWKFLAVGAGAILPMAAATTGRGRHPNPFFEQLAWFEPYNQHFIQDIGAFQIGLGVVLLIAAVLRARFRGGTDVTPATGVNHFRRRNPHDVGLWDPAPRNGRVVPGDDPSNTELTTLGGTRSRPVGHPGAGTCRR